MNKNTIIGLLLMALIFIGFTIYSVNQQQEYNEAVADSQSTETTAVANAAPAGAVAEIPVEGVGNFGNPEAFYGPTLGRRFNGLCEESRFVVENDLLKLTFSTLGGRIIDAELKEYTKYAPKGERNEPVRLFDPESVYFDMSFYIKDSLPPVDVHTAQFCFDHAVRSEDSKQVVTMSLPVGTDARFVYEYTVYNTDDPSRDYMVDMAVRLENMAAIMPEQNDIVIDWRNTSYQNERGFKNENMYTTVAWRCPGESSIDDLSMGDGSKSDNVNESVNWVAFKQQFFSSVIIARDNFRRVDHMGYSTCDPESGNIKEFEAKLILPYNAKTDSYDLAFYLGPNKYAILKNIEDANGETIALERLVPLGWGIFGWVNRWFTIPVFDFLRKYIGSFGLIILILAILVKIIIFPLTYKSYLSTAKMRVIKPEVDALNAKYPNKEDAMKKQQAMMALYKKAGINPLGGCLPMLIQMPIIIAMFRFFPASIELRGQAFLWSHDLSSYDSVLNLPFSIPFYGSHVSLFALLMALVFFLYSYVNYKQTASGQNQMVGMKFMMVYLMPVMMLLWFNSYASGLSYYYFLTTVLSMLQTWIIRRMVDDNKIHAMIQANAAKNANGKKSRFQQRYEEFMRQQQQQKGKRK